MTYPIDGYYDKTQPYQVIKTVICFDGTSLYTMEQKIFTQRSFNKCLYDSDCREYIFEPNQLNKVIHSFGNPLSVLSESNTQYVLCVITDTNSTEETLRKLTADLVREYTKSILSAHEELKKNIDKTMNNINESTNERFEKTINTIFKVGDRVRIIIQDYEHIDKRLKKLIDGAVGEIIEINDCSDYEIDDYSLPSRFLVKFTPTLKDRTEVYFSFDNLELI